MTWSQLDQLLHGYVFEVLPEDRPRLERAARRYSSDPHLSKRDRGYIRECWLPQEEPEPESLRLLPGDAA